MGHYDSTHTCDQDEHNWEKRAKKTETEVVYVSGKPCLKITWMEEEHCTNKGQTYDRGIGHHMKKCQRTKVAEREKSIVPIAALEQWSNG